MAIPALAQPLVPLGDPADTPLLPTGISPGDVELFGDRLYRFKDSDGTHILHFVGGFEFHLGHRRYLSAREAVIWMTSRQYRDIKYQHFDVYLNRMAVVEELAGTVVSAPILFATVNSTGKITLGADATTEQPSTDSNVYREGAEIRTLMLQMRPDDVESTPPVQTFDPQRLGAEAQPEAKPEVRYQADSTEHGIIGDRRVTTAIGNVFVFQDDLSGDSPLEIRADSGVVFHLPDAQPRPQEEGDQPEIQQPPTDLVETTSPLTLPETDAGAEGGMLPGANLEAVYLEGDVVLSRGERVIRASQLYYDFTADRALILDAVAHVIEPSRSVPVYVRAAQVRQLSQTEYAAWDAQISTSEFHTPHFHIGAKRAEFTDETFRTIGGEAYGLQAGTYRMYHTTFNLNNVPIAYWPYATGRFKEGDSTLQGVRTGYGNNFGAFIETQWHLFNLMGVQAPVGFDGTFRLDYFTERGPAAGVDLDYERETYYGLVRSYYVSDDGLDNLGRYRDETPDSNDRGRFLFRHRQYLPDDWELTLENSYISDRGFLEEYFEKEFEQGKDQETAFYLKKQKDNWAFTTLANWRILDWYTQTEHLPEVAFRLIGQPLGAGLVGHSENRAGFVRYRPGEREFLEYLFISPREDGSGSVARGDTRQEIELPFMLGPVKIVPFASARLSAWDDSPYFDGHRAIVGKEGPDQRSSLIEKLFTSNSGGRGWFDGGGSGGLERFFGTAGVRGSSYLSRVFPDIQSALLDINGIRHIIKMDFVGWVAGSTLNSKELYPFTQSVEEIDGVSGGSAGLRQRWQTRRGGPGQQRTVDLLSLDLEFGAFDGARTQHRTNGFVSPTRPENSISQNYANMSTVWRINDSTALMSEANFDLNDAELDIFNLSLAVERDPRFGYLIIYRYIEEIDSNLVAFGANYRLSEKHTIALRESFDLERGRTEEFTLGLIRKFPRWYVGLNLDLNEADDDFGVSLSAWPEGLPQAALGSRRFTGLAESTGIRPD